MDDTWTLKLPLHCNPDPERKAEEPRLDQLLLPELRTEAPELSRAALKPLFARNQILLNGSPAIGSERLQPGDYEVTILNWNPKALAEPKARPSPLGCFLPIVYEDKDLLVLHKISGVPSIPHGPDEIDTAANAALARLPELSLVGSSRLEPGILHRLDTGTSGLLVFAKTQDEFDRLKTEWKEGGVRKIYRAVAKSHEPRLPPKTTIDFPLAHDIRSAKRMIALVRNRPELKARIRGKPLAATTYLRSVELISSNSDSEKPSLTADLEIEIETGVMHQIRCHLASIRWPILGDPLYKGAPSSRLWLHAWRLRFPLRNGMALELEAALPFDWPKAVKTPAPPGDSEELELSEESEV